MELGLERHDLNSIESQYSGKGDNRCLEEVVSTFLNRPSLKPRWQAVINALKSEMVDEGALAVEIEEAYGESNTNRIGKTNLV